MSDAQEVYQSLLDKGISEEELKSEIQRKKHKFGGYITNQGALFLIAKEHGLEIRSKNVDEEVYETYQDEIDLNEFIINIADIQEQMTNIVLVGKIAQVFKLHEFSRKDGTPGIVGSFLLTDPTGTVKIVLWGKGTKIMQTEFFEVGTITRVVNGYAKVGINEQLEVHLSKKGKVILNPEDVPKSTIKKLNSLEIPSRETHTYENSSSGNSQPRNIKEVLAQEGFVLAVSGYVKLGELKEFEKDNGDPSFLLKFTLSDESGAITVNVWEWKAIEVLKLLEDGMAVKVLKVFVRKNEYSGEKELQFTKKSILEFL